MWPAFWLMMLMNKPLYPLQPSLTVWVTLARLMWPVYSVVRLVGLVDFSQFALVFFILNLEWRKSNCVQDDGSNRGFFNSKTRPPQRDYSLVWPTYWWFCSKKEITFNLYSTPGAKEISLVSLTLYCLVVGRWPASKWQQSAEKQWGCASLWIHSQEKRGTLT